MKLESNISLYSIQSFITSPCASAAEGGPALTPRYTSSPQAASEATTALEVRSDLVFQICDTNFLLIHVHIAYMV